MWGLLRTTWAQRFTVSRRTKQRRILVALLKQKRNKRNMARNVRSFDWVRHAVTMSLVLLYAGFAKHGMGKPHGHDNCVEHMFVPRSIGECEEPSEPSTHCAHAPDVSPPRTHRSFFGSEDVCSYNRTKVDRTVESRNDVSSICSICRRHQCTGNIGPGGHSTPTRHRGGASHKSRHGSGRAEDMCHQSTGRSRGAHFVHAVERCVDNRAATGRNVRGKKEVRKQKRVLDVPGRNVVGALGRILQVR